MKVSEDLLQILATTEIANISQSIEYQKLCQANVGDSRFQAERDRVERIKIRVEANLKPPLTTIEEAKAALSLLIRSRRVTEDRDLYHALLVRGYKARWTNKQQAYFDDAWEKIRLEYDFFFSFTTRYPRVEGENPINTAYKYFIIKELERTTWNCADRKKENLLATTVFRLLLTEAEYKGFFFPDSQFDNTMTEEKLAQACRNCLVFVQLIQNIMFQPPEKGENWCHFEYKLVKSLLRTLGNHPKPAIDNHFKTGHREPA